MFRLSIDFFPPSIASMSKVNEYSFLKAIGYIQANNTLIFSLNLIFYPSRECRPILLIDKIESKATEHGIKHASDKQDRTSCLLFCPQFMPFKSDHFVWSSPVVKKITVIP